MLLVLRSNRVERLTDKLMEMLSSPMGGPLDLEWIGVACIGASLRLERSIADRFGIAAGVAFPFPKEILNRICFDNADAVNPFDEEPLTYAVFDLLPSLLNDAAFLPIAQYLENEATDTKRLGLSLQIAHTFSEYAIYRPRMVLEWENGNDDHWQAVLWRTLVVRHGSCHIARTAQKFIQSPDAKVRKLPFKRLSFFCVPTFSPLYLSVLSTLSRFMDVTLYTLSPSMEWWADVGLKNLDEASHHHPLLSALGRTGSDFQWLLEETVPYIEPVGDLHEEPAAGSSPCLLSTIQSDMLNLRTLRRGPEKFIDDDSIEIHSCQGPLRELEVLKDRLLDRFNRDAELRPEDIAVLAPDISVYAPYIESVFGSVEHPIPFSIGARSLKDAAVISAFCTLLDLVTKRLTVREVFDLLSFDPVRERFALSIEDVIAMEHLATKAGIRWGMDGDHRAEFDQPTLEENTWRFGIDRMLMSLCIEPSDGALFSGISPFGSVTQDDRLRLEGFLDFIDVLFDCVLRFRASNTIPVWTDLFLKTASELFLVNADNNGEYQLFRNAIVEVNNSGVVAKTASLMSFSAIRTVVSEKLLSLLDGKLSRSFGVTFADISAYRAHPFSVLALMGMNEGDFPRRRRPPGFDLASLHPMPGDRSVSDDDRFSFLEAILSARDALLITFCGTDAKSGGKVSPSSVVTTLTSVLHRSFGLIEKEAVIDHPVSPFHPKYFTGEDKRLFCFSHTALKGALSMQGGKGGPSIFFPNPLASEVMENVDLRSLIEFFVSPQKCLSMRRLGMRFPWMEKSPPEREPMAQSGEDRILLRMLIERAVSGQALEPVEEEARALGLLPLGDAGHVRWMTLSAQSAPTVEKLRTLKLGPPDAPIPTETVINVGDRNVRVFGEIAEFRSGAPTAFSYNDYDYGKSLIELYIRTLQSEAARVLKSEARLMVFRKDALDEVVTFKRPDAPKEALANLLRLYFEGALRPIPLFPSLSLQFASDRIKDVPVEQALRKARRNFEDLDLRRNASELTMFRGVDPFDLRIEPSFEDVSLLVFLPLITLMKRGEGEAV
jgi:exodeoxyribonuclease V gamma subunit